MSLSLKVFILLLCTVPVVAGRQAAVDNAPSAFVQDSSAAAVIKQELNGHLGEFALHYPKSVKRYYEQRRFEPIWILPQGVSEQVWDAMLLFDCVVQYGLFHSDYHPQELLYEQLDRFAGAPPSGNSRERARFDIMLTDALLAFMNHLHYGKLNPRYPPEAMDNGYADGFDAGAALTRALHQDDFKGAVTGVQPHSAEYADLQENMKLVTSQYVGDCYEIPEDDVRKMAINMERLRWINCNDTPYIHINIPSGILTLHVPDSSYFFRAIIGKPATPTPITQGHIRYFFTTSYTEQSTDAAKSLGKLLFPFANPLGVSLHDTPDQRLFNRGEKALSNGNIWVEKADRLAVRLLEADGANRDIARLHKAMSMHKPEAFTLRKQVPISITYLTCEIKDGLLVLYDDIYGLDSALAHALYQ